MKKLIKKEICWKCNSMDWDADIVREGYIHLFDDDTRVIIWEDEVDDLQYEQATENEIKDFCRKFYHYTFPGDEVTIFKGRKMVGESKTIKYAFRYDIEGTYGKAYVDYLVFTDGTKVNVNNTKNKFDVPNFFYTKDIPYFDIGGRK